MKRIAFAGVSHIHTPHFLKLLKGRPDFAVAAAWDPDRARAEKVAAETGCAIVADAVALWNDPAIDAIAVCSETVRHRELVLPAAARGKHLFVEKPLGFSAADALEMAGAIERAGILFQTGYFMRGQPVHRALKKMVEDGVFGKITRARHVNCHHGSLGGWFDADYRWMADPAQSGCGAFGDLGTHSLDILMWLFGKPERVTAEIRTVTGRYGENCDETGTALLDLPGGVAATLSGGWVDLMNPVTCEISGTEGFAFVCRGKLYIKSANLEGADGETPWTALPEELPHAFSLFLDAVTGKPGVPLVSASEAAERNVVMEALYNAARSRSWLSC